MQIRITLSPPIHSQLMQKAKDYGLSMSEYVKNLIISDMKSHERPVYQIPVSIDKKLNQKNRWKGYDLLDG